MFFSPNREELRRYYLNAWRKSREGLPMEPVEHAIAEVVAEHPEYHAVLEKGEAILEREYLPEQGEPNPFLHMGMHLAVREQVGTNRPAGIRAVFQKLLEAKGTRVDAEHLMMEALAESMWQAQRYGREPDEQEYLRALKRLAKRIKRRS